MSADIYIFFSDYFSLFILILAFIESNKWSQMNAHQLIRDVKTNYLGLMILCIIVCLFIGFRPVGVSLRGDTDNYAGSFQAYQSGIATVNFKSKDYLFQWIMEICSRYVDVNFYFTIICTGYVFFALAGFKRIFKNSTGPAFLFFLAAFSFMSYADNGIRNGLACSMVIYGISLLLPQGRNKISLICGISICYIASLIHNSTVLPILCFVVAYFMRNVKISVAFWLLSIVIYLIASNAIETLFIGLGFDDRMTEYTTGKYSEAATGAFRIDFLIYSFMPILLGFYTCVQKQIQNTTYQILLNTYIFANSFWVMMMGAAFSNRFAYLSWFLYPLVMAYPCFRMNVWGDRQGHKATQVTLAYIGFTVFMFLIYYA